MLRSARLPRSFITFFQCLLLVSWRSASSFPSSSIGRRRTKSIKNPQGFSLKFKKRRSVCYAAFAAGVSHGAWRSPLCARFHTFPRNFVIFSMALRWVCLALAWLWVCLVRSFIHFSNAFLTFLRPRHLPCSVALTKASPKARPLLELASWPASRLAGWLADWPAFWLASWLADWLVGRPASQPPLTPICICGV